MAEKLEELQLPKAQVEIESRGAIYAVPFFKDAELEKPSLSPEDAPGPGARHPPLDTSVSSGHPTSATPFPMAPAVPEAGIPLSCGAKPGSSSPAEEDGTTGTVGQCTAAGHEPSGAGRSSSRCGGARAGVAERSRRDGGAGIARRGQRHPWVPRSPQLSPSLLQREHPWPGHQRLGVGLCTSHWCGDICLSLPRPGSCVRGWCRTAV